MGEQRIGDKIEEAEPVKPDLRAAVKPLAELDPLEYDLVREDEAQKLGVRVSSLDEAVKRARKSSGTSNGKSGRELKLPEPEPWPEEVDGDDLLDQLVLAFRRYVALPDHAPEALALWVVHAHCLDAAHVSPRLFITSPEKRCGKTTLLLVLERLVTRPLSAMNITAAVLFRTVEVARPTLLIDEADSFAKDNEELRGIINSGHHRSGSVIRTVGDDYEPRQFSTWSAIVIAGIGAMPGTIEDRSIILRIRRKRPDETVERLRTDKTPDLDRLARMAARWMTDNLAGLKDADPVMPSALHDRAADNWRAILAIADTAGGDWPMRARETAVALSASTENDDASVRVQLLADIQTVFASEGEDKITSDALCARLHEMEDRPWPEWKAGKPISKIQVARQLKHFTIAPGVFRLGTVTARGYKMEAFNDAFARYLPIRPVTSSQPAENSENPVNRPVTMKDDVTGQNPLKPLSSNDCYDVTGQIGGIGDEGGIEPEIDPFDIPEFLIREEDADIEREAIMNEIEAGNGDERRPSERTKWTV